MREEFHANRMQAFRQLSVLATFPLSVHPACIYDVLVVYKQVTATPRKMVRCMYEITKVVTTHPAFEVTQKVYVPFMSMLTLPVEIIS